MKGSPIPVGSLGSRWVATGTRLVLAAVLAYAAATKIGDLSGAGRTVALYRIVPDDWASPLGGIFPFVELVLAVLLALGLATRQAALLVAGLMAVYVAAIVSVWARGLSIDCGCFSSGGHLTEGSVRGYVLDIARDTGLFALALFLAFRPRSRYALDRWVLGIEEC